MFLPGIGLVSGSVQAEGKETMGAYAHDLLLQHGGQLAEPETQTAFIGKVYALRHRQGNIGRIRGRTNAKAGRIATTVRAESAN